ncbi:hypothetical protein D9M68_814360 [compost metagenome]
MAAAGVDVTGGPCQLGHVAAANYYRCASLDQTLGDFLTDARTASSYDGNLVRKTIHILISSFVLSARGDDLQGLEAVHNLLSSGYITAGLVRIVDSATTANNA